MIGKDIGLSAWRTYRARVREYEDTLRRLLGGDFTDLTPEERQRRVEDIIRLGALAAMAVATAPLPFLELGVQAAMVRAIGKVHGVKGGGRRLLLQVSGALGGGLLLRQATRLLPFAGPLPHLSRVSGATWALGAAADVYFASRGAADRETLREAFSETATRKEAEQAQRLRESDLPNRLRDLQRLRDEGLITETEHLERRGRLLELV